MPIKIIIEQNDNNIQGIIDRYHKIYNKLMTPDPTRAVKQVATQWGLSYRNEGSGVGGWVALAQKTVDDRIRQGFGGEHPIMIRQGSLYAMSTLFFMAGQPGAAKGWSTYGGRSVATSASLSISGGTATLGLSGPKTVHQKGNWTPPARPYWFTDRTAVLAARLGVIEWIEQEVVQ